MSFGRRLLLFDGLAGLISGLAVLSLSGFLSRLYQIPWTFFIFHGGISLSYATYSLTLANQRVRPPWRVNLLIGANLTWATLCLFFAYWFWSPDMFLGSIHLALEWLFVGGLGLYEWRNRDQLASS